MIQLMCFACKAFNFHFYDKGKNTCRMISYVEFRNATFRVVAHRLRGVNFTVPDGRIWPSQAIWATFWRKNAIISSIFGVNLSQTYLRNLQIAGRPNPVCLWSSEVGVFFVSTHFETTFWSKCSNIEYFLTTLFFIGFGLLVKRSFPWCFWLSDCVPGSYLIIDMKLDRQISKMLGCVRVNKLEVQR